MPETANGDMPSDKYGLSHFAQACHKMLLEQTAAIAEELEGSLEAKRLGHRKAAELLHDSFEAQLGYGDPALHAGYWQLKELFEGLREAIRGTRKQEMRIYNYLELDRVLDLPRNLGEIYAEIEQQGSTPRQRFLLLCLGHLLRYEVRGRELDQQIRKFCEFAYPGQANRADEESRRYLTIKERGTDGLPDTEHIRNSISHGRFRFAGPATVEFSDRRSAGGRITYTRTLDLQDFGRFCDLFELKLRMFPLYVEFHNVLVRITRPYFRGIRGNPPGGTRG